MPSANEAALLAAKAYRLARHALRQLATGQLQPEPQMLELLRGVPGRDGKDGVNGRNGIDATGKDGRPGRDGKDGRPGSNGRNGKDGRDGLDGRPGKDGRSIARGGAKVVGGVLWISYTDGTRERAGTVAGDTIIQRSGGRGGAMQVQFDDYSGSEDVRLVGGGAAKPLVFSQPIQYLQISTKGVDGVEGYVELDGDEAESGRGQYIYPNQPNYYPTPKLRAEFSVWLPVGMTALCTGYVR